MNNKILKTIKKYNMLSLGDTVLLAVSGGADSMLMLDFFVNNRDRLGIKIKAAHIEHGIRGQESRDDSLFVSDYCQKHNVEFHLLTIDAVSEAKAVKMGVEEYSRKRRYEFFDTIDCDKIATAHNLTDNCETLLFRLARGTGIKGVCAIPPVRGKIIRPLIEIDSDEIRKYCNEQGIAYRVDSTNASSDYSRNRIRNEILPVLSEINSDASLHISSFIDDINEVNSFLEAEVNSAYNQVVRDNMIIKDELKRLPTVMQKGIIKKFITDNSYSVDRKHFDGICNLIDNIGRLQLSGNIFAVSNKKFIRFADFGEADNNFSFVTQILNIDEFNKKDVDFYCDCDKIVGEIVIRQRMAGDEISPAGRNCRKSLKKLYNELGIPVEKRNQVPVICDDLGVIGVSHYCISERVKTDNSTQKVITIKIPAEDL